VTNLLSRLAADHGLQVREGRSPRYRVFRHYLDAQLARKIGDAVLLAGTWFVAAHFYPSGPPLQQATVC